MRSEAEAPFRSLRLVLFGFQVVAASVALVIGSTQLIAALQDAPGHLPAQEVAQGLAIDVGAIIIFGFLVKRDWDARTKQIARLSREETLGSLQIELANKKTLRLAQLRQFARVVVIAGSSQQVQEALQQAEQHKEQLQERGVLVVPLPIFEDSQTEVDKQNDLTTEDIRWKAKALRQGEWAGWFKEQMRFANKTSGKGLYVGLRLDGRVRASGTGTPPWGKFVAELAPVTGPWGGLLDGMDGRV